MCGIVGIFGKNASEAELNKMQIVTARRGPEKQTGRQIKGGWLGHNLLSFVAIGNNSQPLLLPGITLVWNGEIYNWRELEAEFGFSAKNDTELLAFGLRDVGVEFLRKIQGQFAFIAQIEADGNVKTVVGRDRWGISPLAFGVNGSGDIAIASTEAAVAQANVSAIKTIPAGSYGEVQDGGITLEYWQQLQQVPVPQQGSICPKGVIAKVKQRVESRIPEQRDILFTAMGGIDSQTVTVFTARATNGEFGGAITVVPWDPQQPDTLTLGDYHEAKASLTMLAAEGIEVKHHVAQLNPDYIRGNSDVCPLDRVLSVLGPDYFHVCCGLAEDLVATTAGKLRGKAIMTAGGPDEAGWSYKPWTHMHRGNLEEGFFAIGDQFSSAEGVRAGLVFGEHGIENRVPLAHLIEDAMGVKADQKQDILDWGDANDPLSIKMRDKIFWREAVAEILPIGSLNQPKKTIHGATGVKLALYHVACADKAFLKEREGFIRELIPLGWQSNVFCTLNHLDPNNIITEGQVYCLWRWRTLAHDLFLQGSPKRYLHSLYSPHLQDKINRPLCYDWMISPKDAQLPVV
ncbi:MAG: hypothetical protein JKY34_16485 [Kordiimonadaceae bacterium]|nr:hypothetical protein [Kordiimonadaceae bacterium]